MSAEVPRPFPHTQRTEVELAAQILARLLKQQIIPLGMREVAQRALGVQTFEVNTALKSHWGWVPPRRVDLPAHEQPTKITQLRPVGRNKFANGRTREPNENGEMYCKGCDEWLPVEQFTLRADRPGHRKTKCRACLSAYQAARYLTVQKLDALEAARITFKVDEDSELIGVSCADCGLPIIADDLIHVEGAPRHDSCEDRS